MTEETLVTGTVNTDPGLTADTDGKANGSDKATDDTNKDTTQVETKSAADDGTKKDGDKDATKVVPEKYDFKVPEGMELDAAKAESFSAIAKEAGLTQEAAQKFLDMYVADQAQLTANHQARVKEWIETTKALPEIGGDKLAETIAVANKAVDLAPPEMKVLLKDSGFGNHPAFVQWAYAVGKALSVDKHVPGASLATGGEKSIEERLYPNHPKT